MKFSRMPGSNTMNGLNFLLLFLTLDTIIKVCVIFSSFLQHGPMLSLGFIDVTFISLQHFWLLTSISLHRVLLNFLFVCALPQQTLFAGPCHSAHAWYLKMLFLQVNRFLVVNLCFFTRPVGSELDPQKVISKAKNHSVEIIRYPIL